ncbi:MAG TPA: hypothetical protein ENH70_08715 [Desulfobacteraceae bacterium]|nr:MAG: hypothetical protein DRG82_05365 [Deltaproteobacteria bacterium]HDZ24603.1 hypothetical protein [Desulfobacteraceae bacterium]
MRSQGISRTTSSALISSPVLWSAAIKDYGRDTFKTYDGRIRRAVSFLIRNLGRKYGYTERGAREVCVYAIDNELSKVFSEK